MTSLLRDRDLIRAFDHAAPAYDLLTALNPGHRGALRRSARRLRLPAGGTGLHVLDLGCGTGASTRALLEAAPHARITAVDASAGMLARAAAKPWPQNVTFLHRTAEHLLAAASSTGTGTTTTAATGADTTTAAVPPGQRYDAVFAAYLFRNTTDPDAVLAGVHTLLRPGGRLAVHEYSLSGSTAHRMLWNAVCRTVVEPAGALTGDRGLYRHLRRSVLDFDTAPHFAARLARAGFAAVRTLPVAGWQTGIVHTFLAVRPRPAVAPPAAAARPGRAHPEAHA
ncbi:methyltransferase domain-containing protein [Streptomyces sp. NRRL S-350]|uniref:methyltransferase domain-containing protein n=1 Tax=Streptomyces sp. NRRL S-350 TaxID=1463902 RepID=UPI0004C021A3|nr:methyltransferase domain-containing protein [Streptomyces sp. NRRL S-350]